MNSKAKGKRGELDFVSWMRQNLGIAARRGQQFSGSPDSPDVISDLKGIHFEVKRTEALRLYPAIDQAKAECGEKVPVVAYRRNRGEWLLIIPADRVKDFCDAMK